MAFKMKYDKKGDFPFKQTVAESTYTPKAREVKIKKEKDVTVGDTTFPAGYLSGVPEGKDSSGKIDYNQTDVRRRGYAKNNNLISMIKNISG